MRTMEFRGGGHTRRLIVPRCDACGQDRHVRFREFDERGRCVADCTYCDRLFDLDPEEIHDATSSERLEARLREIREVGW
jgi:hypothetical protein